MSVAVARKTSPNVAKQNLATPLTGGHFKALKFDRFDVVDERGHLLRGVDLAAGCTL